MTRKFFTKYTIVILIVLVFAQVGVSVVYSNFGGTIRDLEEKAKDVALSNQRLSSQLAKFESLSLVASRAGELGFTKSEILYLTPQAPVAAKLDGETN